MDELRRKIVTALLLSGNTDPYDEFETFGVTQQHLGDLAEHLYATYTETLEEAPLIPGITEEEHQKLSFQGAAMTAFWAGLVWSKSREGTHE